jgi:prolyl oligopeptidase
MLSAEYPRTARVTVTETRHGVELGDPYRWLEDQGSPAVQAWMNAQDEFARARLARLPGRPEIAARLRQLLYIDSTSIPRRHGGRLFFSRTQPTSEKAVVYWQEGREAPAQVLLDPNAWPRQGELSLGEWYPNRDGTKVAYTVHPNNGDEATLHVIDIATGQTSPVDVITGANYAIPSWTPEGDGFYYTWLPTDPAIPIAERPGHTELRFHALGTDPRGDRVIHERLGDASGFQHAFVSRDGRWLIRVVGHGWYSHDVYLRDLRQPASGWRPLIVDRRAMFSVRPFRDHFYVHTNEGAARGRVFRIDAGGAQPRDWQEIVPERADATLQGFAIIGGRLVLNYLEDVASRVEIRDLEGRLERELSLPGIGSVAGPVGQPDEDEAFFSFTSFICPTEVHVVSIATGASQRWSRTESPVDADPYLTEQVWFPSRDGTQVSMFIVRRKDLIRDGSTRALLAGYGGFQVSQTPQFNASRFLWLERGGLIAIPHLRGGGEYGEQWHQAGMGTRKQNVFDDFIAAAECLIQHGYTRPELLAISGSSNGGLLVGAALTQRPDLFRVGLCSVPLLDMLRYHLVGAGMTWTSEYGSPEREDEFRALRAYSPYHRVVPGVRYPAVLMLSADGDDRVDPMHARKFAAALQAASTGGPVLLRIERGSGHGGADRISATVEELADLYAFALAETQPGRIAGRSGPDQRREATACR